MSAHRSGAGLPVVLQGPGWGPAVDYLRLTLAPLFEPRAVHVHELAPPAPDTRVRDVEMLATALGAEMDRLGHARVVLVGHSHGALIAAAHGLSDPERVAALVLIAPAFHGREVAPDERRADDRQEALIALRRGPDPAGDDLALARWMRTVLPAYFVDPARMRAFVRRLRGARLPAAAALGASDPADGARVRRRLGDLRVPTLLISGRCDPVATPSRVASAAARIPASEHVVFDASSHHPWFEEPERFRLVIDAFLARHVP